MRQIVQNTPYTYTFTMIQAASHVLALTGATGSMVVTHSKAGASFTYCDVAPAEIATGWYKLPGTTTTSNTIGDLSWHVTANSGDDRDWVDQIIAGVQVATIVQSVKDDLVNQVWATPVRVVTSVSSPVGVASNYDKGNYTLSTVGVEALGPYLGNLVWATPTRTVTGGTITTVTSTTSVASPVGVGSNYDKTGYTLTAAAATAIADSVLDRDMAAGIDSGSTTVRTPRQAFRFLRNKWSFGAGTAVLTVTKEDDATASWTTTVATSASAAPVVGSDPAGP